MLGVGGLVTHSATGVTGPGFNSLVARGHLIFNLWAFTLAGKQG